MGFLEVGSPLRWEDTEEYYKILDYVIKHGALQFLEVYNRVKDRKNDVLKWGDEVEYHLFKKDSSSKTVQLNLIARDLMNKLNAEDKDLKKAGNQNMPTWHPEWGAWMIEATPGAPYGKNAQDLWDLEESLAYRRMRIQTQLGDNEGISLLPAWPRMGCHGFVDGWQKTHGDVANSSFLPDHIINPHPRFGTLVRNIRLRRGRNVNINMPLFKDSNTNELELVEKVESLHNAKDIDKKQEIYMDGMGFGMGCCCLQVTFQARDLEESRYLYDQLAVLCPIFLSLSAGSPIFKGLLANTDCRWDVISQSVDCRTRKETGTDEMSNKMKRGKQRIRKSRYATIDLYISDSPLLTSWYDYYNDNDAEYNEEVFELLSKEGVDDVLGKHIAHLFIRDPLVIFNERVSVDDKSTTEHFENIQSTNWQTMRWKPPPIATSKENEIGWRVEFRPMEVQLTDFENAAYTVTIVLLSRVILFFKLNFYIPISKIDENMAKAHKIDAVLEQKFYFRKKLIPLESECVGEVKTQPNTENDFDYYSAAEILTGKGEEFPGLFPLIYAYLDIIGCDDRTYGLLNSYLTFLRDRSSGKIKTLARWMRDFVDKHESYKKDSIIPADVEFDLVCTTDAITKGELHDETLLGKNKVKNFHFNRKNNVEESDGRRLRGASFSEKFNSFSKSEKQYECQIVTDLINKYRNKKQDFVVLEGTSFHDTPSLLGGTK